MRAAVQAPPTNRALIAICGPSGSGKSSSLEGLDPTTTRIIDLERKGMPWRGPKQHVHAAETLVDYNRIMDAAIKDTSVRLIVIESFTKFCELTKVDCQARFKGFDIWSNYARSIWMALHKCKNTHASVVWTAIDELVKIPNPDGSETARRAIGVDGKEFLGKVEKEFLMVFFTSSKRNKEGKMEYFFETNTDGVTSAKSPRDMFSGPVPNNLAAALKVAKEYYGGEGQVEI